MYYPLMDITDRISEPPKWWFQGIPRYCDYHPSEAAYAPTNLLVKTRCEYCNSEFDVAFGTSAFLQKNIVEPVLGYPLDIKTGLIIEEAYDDPPFHLGKNGFNCIGNSVTADWVAILQVWEGESALNWIRRFDLDGLSPDF
ncbi:hypothetical protein [Sphingomonas sp. PAMC 26621]|uniref:hypothetical protein n=1 Tax=Sphingomonas sp. PAMC 26621 TaxID=1112213 RepID=UPI0011113A94|nr:hypothetical protein [Sphingomonas sp. PAMC 26621]